MLAHRLLGRRTLSKLEAAFRATRPTTNAQLSRSIRQSSFQHASRPKASSQPKRPSMPGQSPVLRHLKQRRHNGSSRPEPTPHLGSPEPAPTLSQRMRKLSREYGWSALGVYLLLSALDFPFCFLAVRTLGTDRIGHWEHAIVRWFWTVVPWPFDDEKQSPAVEDGAGPDGWGVEEAQEANAASNASAYH